jgi:opacity protein-like surface antigen
VDPSEPAPTGPYKKWWFGIHVAQDWAFVGGDQVCMADHQQEDNFACYNPNTVDKPYLPEFFEPSSVGAISSGAVLATTRFLLSVDRAFTPNIMVGVRLGFAIRGGPPAGRKVTYTGPPDQNGELTVGAVNDEGKKFLPIHAEARFSYWFGKNALARPGIRPYVHVGGGMAQVDARVVVRANDKYGKTDVDAWKKLGQGFATLGGGVVYAFTPSVGVQLNINGMYMLTASGLVLEPSLGMVFGL